MNRFIGPFEMIEVLGTGGAGEVWRARVPGQPTDVAVKLLQGGGWSAAAVERFLDEARAAAGLDHPHIVQVLDFDIVRVAGADVPYLAMDVASGGHLGQRPLAWPALHVAVTQVLEGLAHAHGRGVVHLDVKGENILLGTPRDGRTGWRLVDFGIAFALGGIGVESGVSGTPAHMAPEQWDGAWRDLGPWTDLYALACTVWEVVTGGPLFRGSILELAFNHSYSARPAFTPLQTVPAGVEGWLRQLLHIDPRARVRSAAVAAEQWAALAFDSVGPAVRLPLERDWRRHEPPRTPFSMGVLGRGAAASRVPPMVGREAERDLLWQAACRVVDGGSSQALHIKGLPGVGTSRLARWLVERLVAEARASALVVSAPSGTPVADAFGPTLARHLVCHGLDLQGARERLVEGELAPLDNEDVDGLLSRFGLLDGPPLSMARCVALLAAASPLVVVLDGAAADSDAADLVSLLPDTSVLLLITGAGEVPTATPVPVGPLPSATMRAAVEALLPLTPRAIERLLRGAAGHPGEAVQRLLLHIQRGDLLPQGEHYELPDTVAPPPDGADARWDARLDAAVAGCGGESVEHALAVAAAIGMSVSDDRWARALAAPPPPGLMGALLDAGLAVRQPRRGDWRFAHPRALAAVERRARAGGWLQGAHGCCADTLGPVSTPGVWGRHLLEAGRPAEAIAPLRQQVDAWLDVARVEEAAGPLDALERALDALERPADDVERGWAFTFMARVDYHRQKSSAAMDLSERAMAIARRHDDPDLLAEAGRCLAASRSRVDPKGARAAIAALEQELGGGADPRLFARLAAFGRLLALNDALGTDGRLAVAETEALLASQPVPAMQRGDLLRRLAWFAPDAASRRGRVLEAMEAFVTAHSFIGQASCHYELAQMAKSADDLEGALRHWVEAERLFVVAGKPASHQSRMMVGHALACLGRHREADARLASAVGGASRAGAPLVVFLGLVARAAVAARDQRWEDVAAYVAEAEVRAVPLDQHSDFDSFLMDAPELALQSGRSELAERMRALGQGPHA